MASKHDPPYFDQAGRPTPVSRSRATTEEERRFQDLYEAGWPIVWSVARRLLGSDADAEEAAQNVFARLWKRGNAAMRAIDSPKPYFTTAALREAQTLLRQQDRWVDLGASLVGRVESDAAGPEEELIQHEIQAVVRSMLIRLPPKCREVMSAIVCEGLTRREAADRLGMKLKAVEKQITNAHRLVRQMAETMPLDTASGALSTNSDGGGEGG